MAPIKSESGKKEVRFKKDATGKIGCFFIQDNGIGGEQVIDAKWCKSEKAALAWAKKQIG